MELIGKRQNSDLSYRLKNNNMLKLLEVRENLALREFLSLKESAEKSDLNLFTGEEKGSNLVLTIPKLESGCHLVGKNIGSRCNVFPSVFSDSGDAGKTTEIHLAVHFSPRHPRLLH